jgi:twitching motility two-component system response regulator PilH
VAFDQIMLSLLSNAITTCPNKPVVVKISVQKDYVVIDITGEKTAQNRAVSRNLEFQNERRYEVARQLIALSKGTIQINEAHELFSARLSLPYVQQVPVLVVDDNPDMLQIIQRYAQDSRYRIVATQSATQAMELAKQIPPVAIILDVMIPQIDGWKLLGRFREHPATSKVPVIICTVLPQEELAISLGAVAFLKKPFSRQNFLAALDPWVEPGE